MNKLTTTILFATAFFVVSTTPARATVGGEWLIFDLYYNTQTKSVIYTSQDYGGRGCPPDLIAKNTVTDQMKTIFGCSDDKLPAKYSSFAARNADYTKDFQRMYEANIKKLGIGVTFTKTGEEKLKGDDWLVRTKFLMTVTQNGLKIYESETSGCSVDQPWVIGGFMAQDLKNKLVLLVSGKGDCFEGGYVTERIFIVPAAVEGAEYLNTYKGERPLVPTVGNLVVYGQAEKPAEQPVQNPTQNSNDTKDSAFAVFESTRAIAVLGIFSLISFILGLLMGKLIQVPRGN